MNEIKREDMERYSNLLLRVFEQIEWKLECFLRRCLWRLMDARLRRFDPPDGLSKSVETSQDETGFTATIRSEGHIFVPIAEAASKIIGNAENYIVWELWPEGSPFRLEITIRRAPWGLTPAKKATRLEARVAELEAQIEELQGIDQQKDAQSIEYIVRCTDFPDEPAASVIAGSPAEAVITWIKSYVEDVDPNICGRTLEMIVRLPDGNEEVIHVCGELVPQFRVIQ